MNHDRATILAEYVLDNPRLTANYLSWRLGCTPGQFKNAMKYWRQHQHEIGIPVSIERDGKDYVYFVPLTPTEGKHWQLNRLSDSIQRSLTETQRAQALHATKPESDIEPKVSHLLLEVEGKLRSAAQLTQSLNGIL